MKQRGQETENSAQKTETETVSFLLAFSVFCLLSSVFWSSVVHACPGCSEALFDPAQGAARAGSLRGYLVSIIVLLGAPALMIGGVTLAVMRASRRAQRGRPTVDTHGTSG